MPKKTSKAGIVTHDILNRYSLIRAVYRAYYTSLDVPAQDVATEFFFVVGDILEGKPLGATRLRYLDLEVVKKILKEG